MDITSGMIDAGLSFLLLFLIFRPLELAHPAQANQRFFRPGWWTDFFFFLSEYLLFNGLVFWLLTRGQHWIQAITPHLIRETAAGMRWWMQAIIVVALGDILIYWGHRLQHRIGFLWRFHAIHHSAEHLDWLAAHREHPIDSLYTIFLVNLPMFALGFPIRSLAYFAAFRGLWAVFIHSNVRLPMGPLRIFIGAPELHHWHHDCDRHSGNYGNVSPIMDLLFGTYHCPDHEPERVGIEEPMPKSFIGLMLHPFRRRPADK